MPESKSRKKVDYTPPEIQISRKPLRIGSPRWVAPAMVTFFLIGLGWIVGYYIAPDSPPFQALTYWNVLIGFILIGIGFIFATKWK